MTIIGFNFTKISAEKLKPAKGKITVNRRCEPTSVEEVQIGTGQKALRYTFEFSCSYTPEIANIMFSGDLTQLVDNPTSAAVLKSWNEKKTIPVAQLEKVMNAILNRCHTESLIMAKELNIPPPFNLPTVKVQQAKKADKE